MCTSFHFPDTQTEAAPADPALEDPTPVDSAPADPGLKVPVPLNTAPVETALEDRTPVDPAPAQPAVKEPAPADPAQADPFGLAPSDDCVLMIEVYEVAGHVLAQDGANAPSYAHIFLQGMNDPLFAAPAIANRGVAARVMFLARRVAFWTDNPETYHNVFHGAVSQRN